MFECHLSSWISIVLQVVKKINQHSIQNVVHLLLKQMNLNQSSELINSHQSLFYQCWQVEPDQRSSEIITYFIEVAFEKRQRNVVNIVLEKTIVIIIYQHCCYVISSIISNNSWTYFWIYQHFLCLHFVTIFVEKCNLNTVTAKSIEGRRVNTLIEW